MNRNLHIVNPDVSHERPPGHSFEPRQDVPGVLGSVDFAREDIMVAFPPVNGYGGVCPGV